MDSLATNFNGQAARRRPRTTSGTYYVLPERTDRTARVRGLLRPPAGRLPHGHHQPQTPSRRRPRRASSTWTCPASRAPALQSSQLVFEGFAEQAAHGATANRL
ncbi:hypothetical protein QJS66_03175 [Kocuria rhizophila]|nr:hypothetical protein QJS66_03175 [Kocuria rhizophila]